VIERFQANPNALVLHGIETPLILISLRVQLAAPKKEREF